MPTSWHVWAWKKRGKNGMEIVWGGMILTCLALSIPFIVPIAIKRIVNETGEELYYDQLYFSIAPIVWKSHQRERALFRKHCPIPLYYAWTMVHVVFLVVITLVPLIVFLQNT